ncbi:hypothetical protein [Paenibacillus sp. Leaf72]|uniref:hypothetical protein n=1 Tax=Paenibacillus sp. Leaf72 TaxID=1736234 RepID=UPI0006F58CAF|nr:hypothetical protein [Paenibacillus sp. Leaf72]KQO18063.1 hypothetical protein ASF12_05325 [Paenibacillus sp. Leaf72]
MERIQWVDANYELISYTPIWENIQAILRQMSYCFEELNHQDNEHKLDYVIEVVGFQDILEQSQPLYWLRVNLFLIHNPAHTFTILTLRCNEDSAFPLLLDVNYSKESDPIYIEELNSLNIALKRECVIGLQSVTDAVNNYLFQIDRYSELRTPHYDRYVNTGRMIAEATKTKRWTDEENELFIKLIDEYRKAIAEQERSVVKAITRDFAFKLKRESELLQERTEQAIYEHLAYFDDLLAGAGEITDYAKKDVKHFAKHTRPNGGRELNVARIFRGPRRY